MLIAMSSDGKGGRARRRAISRPLVPPGPLADLKALLCELYVAAGTPTLDQVAAQMAADEHEDLAGAPGRDTIVRIIGDPGMPSSQADVAAVAAVLARAARWDSGDAAGRARNLWVAARMADARIPAAGVRVSEADPRRLGVHAAIRVSGVPDETPPEYVPRDADGGEFGVRAKVASAAERGGSVLLVGGCSGGSRSDLLPGVACAWAVDGFPGIRGAGRLRAAGVVWPVRPRCGKRGPPHAGCRRSQAGRPAVAGRPAARGVRTAMPDPRACGLPGRVTPTHLRTAFRVPGSTGCSTWVPGELAARV
jgi:hypothetical protein